MSEEAILTPIETELDAYFGQYTAANQSRGLVYGLVSSDGLEHASGFGSANDDGLVPDADTLFPIASLSKSFVACATLIARDRGLLSLTDPITKYVPEFRVRDGGRTGTSEADPPTIGMLLSMCGGLTEDNSWVDPFTDTSMDDLLELVAKGLRLSRTPGSAYEYSNLGYAMANLALSPAVGKPLADFVKQEIFTPLGLACTHFDRLVPDGGQRASGYTLDQAGRWLAYPTKSSQAFEGPGGIVSTVRDVASWIAWLSSAFRPDLPANEPAVLSRASRRELQRLHVLIPPMLGLGSDGNLMLSVAGYALGLFVGHDLHRGNIIWHSGGIPGFRLYMRWHSDSGHGIVVFTNSHRGDPMSMGQAALSRVLVRANAASSTFAPWPETFHLRAEAEALIRSWDDTRAEKVFAPNIDFDRSLAERRCEIERLRNEVGPLDAVSTNCDLVSSATPADLTWAISGKRGQLLCMVHLTPTQPAQIQEFVVKAFPAGVPRSSMPIDISPRGARGLDQGIMAARNVRLEVDSVSTKMTEPFDHLCG